MSGSVASLLVPPGSDLSRSKRSPLANVDAASLGGMERDPTVGTELGQISRSCEVARSHPRGAPPRYLADKTALAIDLPAQAGQVGTTPARHPRRHHLGRRPVGRTHRPSLPRRLRTGQGRRRRRTGVGRSLRQSLITARDHGERSTCRTRKLLRRTKSLRFGA